MKNLKEWVEACKAQIPEYVTEAAKAKTVGWIKDTLLPAAREIADAYLVALKASAEGETAWCKFRDTMLIPGIVNVTFWFVGLVLSHTVED